MTLNPNAVQIFAALRDTHMREYFELTMLLWLDREERDQNRATIAERNDARNEGQSFGLTALLRTDDYHDLVEALNAIDPERSMRVQTILEVREYEERLVALKQGSMQEYIDELRVISMQELYDAVRHGTVVNAVDPEGAPLAIASDESYSATFMEQPVATAWVDARLLAEVLGSFGSPENIHSYGPQGLRLRQVVIGGDAGLNLNWLRLPFPLGFQGCDFYHWISADYAELPWLSFENCDFTPHSHALPTRGGAFNGSNLQVTHDLKFWECSGFSQLFVPNASIGSFVLRGVSAKAGKSDDAEATNEDTWKISTVVDGATFGEVIVTESEESGAVSPFSFATEGTPPTIQRIEGEASAICAMLKEQGASQRVWDEFADALERSGEHDEAVSLRVNYQRWNNTRRPWYKRPLFAIFGDWAVGYLHRPFQVWRPLALVFAATFAIAFFFHDQLIKSPIANDAIPASWFQEVGSTGAWAFMYSLDSTFAPLSLGQVEIMWLSSAWLLLLLALLKGLSLIFLALFISSATTLVSKKSN